MASLSNNRRWELVPYDPAVAARIEAACGVTPLVARIMAGRGILDEQQARAFLAPSLDRDWADPALIPGLAQVVDRLDRALDAHERIAVFGDFDVDGISATCLLTDALRALGGDVYPFIPRRFEEGYGLSAAALERLLGLTTPQLVVTVDTGIAAAAEVEALLAAGISVTVTDHHEPGDLVPAGVPVCDPKLDASCPSRELAGVGVALKVVCALGARRGQPELWRGYTDLATLGTVSDMMLLTGENRSLVAEGIGRMHAGPRVGLAALAEAARRDITTLTADDLAFSLIPRLNAAGRMDDPAIALDLLMETDPDRAAQLAARLEQINQERRAIEGQLAEEACAAAEATYDGGRVVVVGGRGWHEGVKGIVASRLVARYHVPTLIFTVDDAGIARGSGRSVGSVNLFQAVERCADLLVRFGGHAGAVGVTLEASKLDAFRARMQEVLAELPEEAFEDRRPVAAQVTFGELDLDTVRSLAVMQPFGQGNEVPVLATTGAVMSDRRRRGDDGRHLSFTATDATGLGQCIMFNAEDVEELAEYDGAVDLVFEPKVETWQGRVSCKLHVKDVLRRSQADACDVDPATAALVDGLFARADEPASGPDGAPGAATPAPACDPAPERARLAGLTPDALTDELRRLFVGDHDLLPAQAAALERLDAGVSTLCVMATGRGKSLIFHLHAARCALRSGRASVFVYPLRALVSDQAFHLERVFGRLGMAVRVLTGETPADERASTFAGLASGAVDVVLTTPEFLAIHTEAFARGGRVGFVVVDEAHHAGQAVGGERPAYLEMPRVLAALGNPVVLAVTATASTPVAREICRLLGIGRAGLVLDPASRENLHVVDERGGAGRDDRLVSLLASGEKTLVYVNSREQTVALARMLRRRVWDFGQRVAFYNGGLSRADRAAVEEAFRAGHVTTVVSTSAFGEGVNLPDVRHVVLYHLPFDEVAFNQMSGRAGRDGRDAWIHLAFGGHDARINERILASDAPPRGDLVTLYRVLAARGRASGGRGFSATDAELAQECVRANSACALTDRGVACGLAVFCELGFVSEEGFGPARRLVVAASPEHMDLGRSVRYAEGLRAWQDFAGYRDWALASGAAEVLARVCRPIVPDVQML
jgi:single-stranded-DNA-specific exonuclease